MADRVRNERPPQLFLLGPIADSVTVVLTAPKR